MPQVTSYKISLFARQTANAPIRGKIVLSGLPGDMATLVFRDEGVPITTVKRADDLSYELPMSAWQPIVDFLRNEKPVFGHFGVKELELVSGTEGVGEGES